MAAYSVTPFGSAKNSRYVFVQNEACSEERCTCLIPVGHDVISENIAYLRPETGRRQW